MRVITALLAALSLALPTRAALYPDGDDLPFIGYSGVPARDKQNGFTMAGPDYGMAFDHPRRAAIYQTTAASGLPTVGFIGLPMRFHDKEKRLVIADDELRAEIAAQVEALKDNPSIAWWYVTPEEIRFWVKDELRYLEIVTKTIREKDPRKRPIWMYEPNNRTGEALARTGVYQDVIGKGAYVNLAGYGKDRIWVKWSVEQELAAIRKLSAADGRRRFALVMPELCQDPADPADDALIPRWTRHDVYLGLISGARGVAIWSLFKRPGVKRTWQLWYDGYTSVAKELAGPDGFGKLFLTGSDDPAVNVRQTSGPERISLFTGDRKKLETATTSEKEKASALHHYAPLSFRILKSGGVTHVFLCNSLRDGDVSAEVTIPPGAKASVVSGNTTLESAGTTARCTLAPYEVTVLRITSG